jgi:SAM-dependent methyltransferase
MRKQQDAALAELTACLGLEWPQGMDAWEERLRASLDAEVYAEYLEYRMGQAAGPEASTGFYDFVGRSPGLALLLQEARLDYHAAALPATAESLASGPHGTVVDIGCGCGLATIWLARRFPGSRFVGVERSAGLVALARELAARAGAANVEFVCGDYAQGAAGGPFDAAVSLQAMPAYFLPFLPSEAPETYRRGEPLIALADDPVLPHRRVARCLAAVRAALRPGGRAVLHERLGGVPQALLFSLLACRARLGPRSTFPVSWEAANEVVPGRRSAPLVIAEALSGPAAFDEDQALALLHPPAPSLPPVPAAGTGQMIIVNGPLAAQAFRAVMAAGAGLCVRARMRDGLARHLHLGRGRNAVAFSYACDTHDGRELKLAHADRAAWLFAAEADALRREAAAGRFASLEPPAERLPELLRAALGPDALGG